MTEDGVIFELYKKYFKENENPFSDKLKVTAQGGKNNKKQDVLWAAVSKQAPRSIPRSVSRSAPKPQKKEVVQSIGRHRARENV